MFNKIHVGLQSIKNQQVMECIYCHHKCIKKGKTRNKTQRYQCKVCKRTQQESYSKNRICREKYEWVKNLTNEGSGIRSISRLLGISASSVQRVIERLSDSIEVPVLKEEYQSYEIDEIRTYCKVKKNELWITYAINRKTKHVIDFAVGKRTKDVLRKVTATVLNLHPKKVYTDGLNIYKSLLPDFIHKVHPHCTNRIERNNLTLRTWLKRLNRKTICFTKKPDMLYHSLKLLFWCEKAKWKEY